jgi:TonB family protein
MAELELRALASTFASTEPALDAWAEEDALPVTAVDASLAAPAGSPAVATGAARVTTQYIDPARRPRKRRFLFPAFACVAAVALATAGMTARSRANAENVRGPAIADVQAVVNVAASAGTAASTTITNTSLSTAERESATGIVQAGAPMTDSVAPAAPPKLPSVPKNLAAITTQLIAATNADSMVRASTKLDRALASDRIGSGIVASSQLDDAGARPATLIAPAPLPHFPDELRAQWSESEVVVRFRVDERGRVDVGSMKVLKSDHELFAAAVREALPRFRFEPARSAAPQSRPVADWVDFRVTFRR